MPYVFYPTKSTDWVRETEYGSASQLTFSRFESCVGLVARHGDKLTGVHLVVLDVASCATFDTQAAEQLPAILSIDKADEFGMVGLWNEWEKDPNDPIKQGFLTIEGKLAATKKTLTKGPCGKAAECSWTATIDGGKIKFEKSAVQQPALEKTLPDIGKP
jgi:hypothetical protein